MKSLLEYITEQFIFEKKSLNKLSEILADKAIKLFKDKKFVELPDIKNQNVDGAKTIKIEGIKEKIALYISYSEKYEGDTFLNNISFKGDLKDIGIILIKANYKDIDNTDDTLAHEIRHFFDEVTGKGGDINNTYEKEDLKRFEGFLYYMSPTEQNAFAAGFRKKIKKNIETFQKWYKASGAKNIDEFMKIFSLQFIKRRHDLLKNENNDDENKLKNKKVTIDLGDQSKELPGDAACENPIRLIEYKYYILDKFEYFENFINYKLPPIPGEKVNPENKRSNEDKEYIINHLAVLNNGNTDLKKLYSVICKKYNQTFKIFKSILQNYLK